MILYDSLYSVLVHLDLTETQILLDRKPKLVDSAAMFISTLCKPMSGVYVFKCLTIEEVDLVFCARWPSMCGVTAVISECCCNCHLTGDDRAAREEAQSFGPTRTEFAQRGSVIEIESDDEHEVTHTHTHTHVQRRTKVRYPMPTMKPRKH